MKRHHIHIVVAAAMCLLFNMTRPYISHNEVYENVISELQKQMEASFNASHDVMSAPHFQNTIPAPHVQFTSLKKAQTTTNSTVIPRRLPINFKFSGPKTSPQSSCCFASPNDFFVVMLRHLII